MRRILWLVGVVVLLDMAFYAAVSPLLPQYVDEFGLSKAEAGLLATSYAIGTVAGSLPGGWLVGRLGPKPTVLLGLGLLIVASLAFAFAHTVVLLDAARFVQGIGGAFTWAAGMAWLVGMSPPERRGQLIGAAMGAAVAGLLLGPMIGGLATELGDVAVFCGVSALAGIVSLWAWSVPAPPRVPGGGPTELLTAFKHRQVLAGLWVFSLPALFAGALEVLVPLELGELGASGLVIGAAFLAGSVCEIALSPLSGRWSDRHGRLPAIRIGLIGAAVMGVVMPLPDTTLILSAALVATVAALGIVWAPAMALVSDACERAGLQQGIAFALGNLGWAFGHIIGGGGGSAIADLTSDAVVYTLLAVLCAAAALTIRSGSTRWASPLPPLSRVD